MLLVEEAIDKFELTPNSTSHKIYTEVVCLALLRFYINLSRCLHISLWSCVWCTILSCRLMHIYPGLLLSLLPCNLRCMSVILILRSYSITGALQHLSTIIMQNFLKALNIINVCQVCSVDCVSKIWSILAVVFCEIYGAVCHELCSDDCENIVLHHSSIMQSEIRFIAHYAYS